MKKLFCFLVFTAIFLCGEAQQIFPEHVRPSSERTLTEFYGGIKATKGFGFLVVEDTAAANLIPFIKNYRGWSIQTSDNKVYVRDFTASRWVEITGGAGGGSFADSTIFPTTYRLDTAKNTIRTQYTNAIRDSADNLRNSIGQVSSELNSLSSAVVLKMGYSDTLVMLNPYVSKNKHSFDSIAFFRSLRDSAIAIREDFPTPSSGSGGGLSELGDSDFGLIKSSDSSYNVDSTYVPTIHMLNSGLNATVQTLKDSAAAIREDLITPELLDERIDYMLVPVYSNLNSRLYSEDTIVLRAGIYDKIKSDSTFFEGKIAGLNIPAALGSGNGINVSGNTINLGGDLTTDLTLRAPSGFTLFMGNLGDGEEGLVMGTSEFSENNSGSRVILSEESAMFGTNSAKITITSGGRTSLGGNTINVESFFTSIPKNRLVAVSSNGDLTPIDLASIKPTDTLAVDYDVIYIDSVSPRKDSMYIAVATSTNKGIVSTEDYNKWSNEYWILACSDETTPITTGQKLAFGTPHSGTLAGVRGRLTTASSDGNVIVDVRKNGVSIMTSNVVIDEGEKSSVTASSPPVILTPEFADDDEITIHVISEGVGATGLKITLLYKK